MSTTDESKSETAVEEINLGGAKKKWLWPAVGAVIAIVAVIVLVVALSGGGNEEKTAEGSHFDNNFKISYQASSASEKAFLDYLNKEIAPDHGVTIEPLGIEDGNQLDQATSDGEHIANIYQHKHWLKQVTDSTDMKLTALGEVFQWSYSVYSEKYKSLDDLPKGATVALLNDPANTAQALWILERAGKLEFKEGVKPWKATDKDIAKNVDGYKFKYIEYGSGPRSLESVDAVVDYNMSFVDAKTPDKYRIYEPAAPKEFAGQLVVGTDYLKDPQVAKLKKIFFDPRVQKHLKNNDNPNLKGQLAPVSEK